MMYTASSHTNGIVEMVTGIRAKSVSFAGRDSQAPYCFHIFPCPADV